MVVFFACLLLPRYAGAGEQTYGCIGKLADARQVIFTPERLMIVSAELASGKLATATQALLESYEATQENYAIAANEPYTFTAGARKVSLVPRSRKQLGEQTGDAVASKSECAARNRGPRQFTRTLWNVVFKLALPKEKAVDVPLDCFEYVISTCS